MAKTLLLREMFSGATFTRLFFHRHKNREAICLGLRLLAGGVARRFWFASKDERNEVEATALLFAIERIDRFDPRRGTDGFSYYTSLITHSIIKELRKIGDYNRRAVFFSVLLPSHDRDQSAGTEDAADAFGMTHYARAV